MVFNGRLRLLERKLRYLDGGIFLSESDQIAILGKSIKVMSSTELRSLLVELRRLRKEG